MTKVEYHSHTSASHDCNVSVFERVRRYAELGFTHLAITDHDKVVEKNILKKINDQGVISIIPGIEVSTFVGHIILLNCRSKPLLNDPIYILLISRIKDMRISIPHPMRPGTGLFNQCNKKRIPFWYQEIILKSAEYVEVYNHRDKKIYQEEISENSLQIIRSKILIAASDTHTESDIYKLGCPLDGLTQDSELVNRFFNSCVVTNKIRIPSWKIPFSYLFMSIKYQLNVN